jgi:signal transduction histidine kinase
VSNVSSRNAVGNRVDDLHGLIPAGKPAADERGPHEVRLLAESAPRRVFLVVGFVSILLIGVLDYFTGPQISSSLFYLLPILFVTHFAGRGVGTLAALSAAGLWLAADLMPPSIYEGVWIPGWNALMRFGVFLIAVWLVSSMRNLTESLELRVEQRTEQLRLESAERRNLEKRILEISEREQARMGQDLHDGLCQHLVGTAFAANLLQQKLADRGLAEAGEVAQIANLLDESITHARQLARGLYPVRIEEQGLVIALEELAETMGSMFRISCEFELTGEAPMVCQLVAVHLYRIAQEAVTNAMKHARPDHVWMRLRATDTELALRVEDDGVGIATGSQSAGGLGLKIMEFRARMIDGRFQIRPRIQGGTTVVCELMATASTAAYPSATHV